MIALALLALQADAPYRTPAIYRIPAKFVRLDRLEAMMTDDGFDQYCIEPKATPEILAVLAKGKVKAADPKAIDTAANLDWRNATIELAAGKISFKKWLTKTEKLKSTVHFLTNPKTKELYAELGMPSYRSTLAEMFLLSWPGRICLASTDIWQARWWPENDSKIESWILAMNDYMGPMLYYRSQEPFMAMGKSKILLAPDKPGLFAFQQTSPDGKRGLIFYFNNGPDPVKLPKVDLDRATISRGLNVEDDGSATLSTCGSTIIQTGEER